MQSVVSHLKSRTSILSAIPRMIGGFSKSSLQRSMSSAEDKDYDEPETENVTTQLVAKVKSQFLNQVTLVGEVNRPPRALINGSTGEVFGYKFWVLTRSGSVAPTGQPFVRDNIHSVTCYRRTLFPIFENTDLSDSRVMIRGSLHNVMFPVEDSTVPQKETQVRVEWLELLQDRRNID